MANEPLVKHIYTADPSAHVFNNKLYIYPSHDRETDIQFNDNGDQYDMNDYHVFSLETVGGPVTDHGVVLKDTDIPWNGKYYLYFPARDREGIFRIGVAVGDKPEGPFAPQPNPIRGSYSIDPAAFVDDDGQAYLYFGGIWGGQLQCWSKSEKGEWEFDASKTGPQEPSGEGPLAADDHERRFFEAAWMHKYNGKYYFSWSTGDTHYLVYATGDSPLGPFTYRGRILEPVLGWTTHHSIAEFQGKWYLFYHDCSLSGGVDHLRSVKMQEIVYDADGNIKLAE
ncbi:glycoside hydrolase family 43 protein [Aspergillus novofumigatus IBT 16806]|uniref:Putative xylosidase n=1 Tax=Aspergillus novofumigatus (strain IBT 16806) TaxID=1392255 RepID=A0A2I1C020_ASPN1|nr:putative xylosidase [Aspergillus novofumigatus IBT 16806]PKX90980.1 putative xylosidase [Aspergillus novofumigatus IBT 16806]